MDEAEADKVGLFIPPRLREAYAKCREELQADPVGRMPSIPDPPGPAPPAASSTQPDTVAMQSVCDDLATSYAGGPEFVIALVRSFLSGDAALPVRADEAHPLPTLSEE